MPVALTSAATEKSTYAVTAAFTDDAGSSVVPNSVTWSLTDQDGTVINDLEDEVITPAASVTIVLSGADLALIGSEDGSGRRVLTVEAVYDSNIGSNLPLKEEASFLVVDLIKVT